MLRPLQYQYPTHTETHHSGCAVIHRRTESTFILLITFLSLRSARKRQSARLNCTGLASVGYIHMYEFLSCVSDILRLVH